MLLDASPAPKQNKCKAMLCRPCSLLLSLTFCVLASLQSSESTKVGNTALIFIMSVPWFARLVLETLRSTISTLRPTLYAPRFTICGLLSNMRVCVYIRLHVRLRVCMHKRVELIFEFKKISSVAVRLRHQKSGRNKNPRGKRNEKNGKPRFNASAVSLN